MSTTLGTPLIMPDETHEGEPEPEPRVRAVPTAADYAPIGAPVPQPHPQHAPPGLPMGYDPSMGGSMGAYYPYRQNKRVGAPAAIAGTVNPALGAALGVSPLAAAGLGVGGAALILTAYVAAMGGLGYWLGGKLSPDEDDSTYKWAGAVGNVLAPGIGLGAVALVALLKKD